MKLAIEKIEEIILTEEQDKEFTDGRGDMPEETSKKEGDE